MVNVDEDVVDVRLPDFCGDANTSSLGMAFFLEAMMQGAWIVEERNGEKETVNHFSFGYDWI